MPRRTLAAAALIALSPALLGADGGADGGADPVVLRAGAVTVTASELERSLGELAPFQLAGFGDRPDVIRRRYVEQETIPDALYVAGAQARRLDTLEPAAYLVRRALSNATLRNTRAAVPPPAAIPLEEVRASFEQNRARWDRPERINVWRILVKTRDEAQAVLTEARRDATPAAWVKLARERSLDKATYLRGGNLGFLAPDGISSEAGFKADLAVVKAAREVKDGEMVPHVVEEPGAGFAVVWRRGTMAATKRTFEEAAPQLREILYRRHVEDAQAKLLADLRARKVKHLDEELVKRIDVFPEAPAPAPSSR